MKRKPILSALYADDPNAGNAGNGGGGQGQQAGAPALPPGVVEGSAAAQAIQAQQGGNTPPEGAPGDQKPAGYVPVAELAQERQKRHALEQQVAQIQASQSQQMEALKQAFGLGDKQQTPEQIQAAMTQQADEHRSALVQLSVHQLATAAGADPVALLDSNKFLSSIKDLQPGDHAGLTKAITEAVANNKTLAAAKVATAGASDAGQGAGGGGKNVSVNDLIRAAAGFGG